MFVMIAGTRGVPADHGGFETFAEDLSVFLATRGHHVTVYCQAPGDSELSEDIWNGVHRVHIPAADTAAGTISYDWATTRHCSLRRGVILTLGYNTAVFSFMYRLYRKRNLMNMDGIEWKRQKWTMAQRAWLWLNEWAGARLANHLVADHPQISAHLRRHTAAGKISVIPYGSDVIETAPGELLKQYALQPRGYYLVIARPEPENSILEIVRAFSLHPEHGTLAVLGHYKKNGNVYKGQVIAAAGPNVRFLGAIYDRQVVAALRYHAKAYIHGHRVGGTNPSLVESLGAGNAIIAHDNRFNRWVAGEGARYFSNSDDLELVLYALDKDPSLLLRMAEFSCLRHRELFGKEQVLLAYEDLLMRLDKS